MQDIQNKLRNISKNITVLYVEDDENTRRQYLQIFKLLFKDVQEAENGKVALEVYKEQKYDLIITDLTMPQMGGVALINEVLKITPSQHAIVITAHNTSENLKDTIEQQIDGILIKPISMEKLFRLLHKVCYAVSLEKKELENNWM